MRKTKTREKKGLFSTLCSFFVIKKKQCCSVSGCRCGGIQDFSAPYLPPCSLCADPSQASQRHNSLMSILISVSHTFIFPTEKGRRRKGYKGRGGGESDEETKALEKL